MKGKPKMDEYDLIRCKACGRITAYRGVRESKMTRQHREFGAHSRKPCPGYAEPGEPVNLVELVLAELPDTCERVGLTLGVTQTTVLKILKALQGGGMAACEPHKVRQGQIVKMWSACDTGAQAGPANEFGKGVK